MRFQYIPFSASGVRVEAINNTVFSAEINSGARVYKKFNAKADTSIAKAQLHFLPSSMVAGSTITISNIKVSFGDEHGIYTTVPIKVG